MRALMIGRAEADTMIGSDGSPITSRRKSTCMTGGAPMLDDREWIVPCTRVRHADGVPRAERKAQGGPRERARVVELRGRVRDGYYASASMMDAVARRILAIGDR
jgi:hypothetical protein